MGSRRVVVVTNGVAQKMWSHDCRVCGLPYEDTIEMAHICTDCDNEFAEWIDEMGYKVGEFDCYDHPNFVPDAFKGTKWEKLLD